MQVQVSIVLQDEREYADWVARQGMLEQFLQQEAAPGSQDVEAPVATSPTTPADTGEPTAPPTTVQKKKRKRRTKAEIAADDVERAASATAEVARAEAADASGPAVESIVPKPDSGEKVYTLEDAMPIMRAFIREHNSPPLVKKLTALGVERVNEIAPEQVSAFLAELVAETTTE